MASSLARMLGPVRDALFPRRMCAKKTRYATEGEARCILRRRQPLEQAQLWTYQCPECSGWHLTKMAQLEATDLAV